MLFEKRSDLLVSCKSVLACVPNASPDACKLFRRWMILAGAEPGVDLKRKFGEFCLSGLGPCFDPFQNVFEFLRWRGGCIAQSTSRR
jgi:hypothetical protein